MSKGFGRTAVLTGVALLLAALIPFGFLALTASIERVTLFAMMFILIGCAAAGAMSLLLGFAWLSYDARDGVKAKLWVLFAAWQTAGALIGYGAHHVDRLSWTISTLMLMPGTLATLYVFRVGGPGNIWPKWTMFAIAAGTNLVLFAMVVMLKKIRGSSKLEPSQSLNVPAADKH